MTYLDIIDLENRTSFIGPSQRWKINSLEDKPTGRQTIESEWPISQWPCYIYPQKPQRRKLLGQTRMTRAHVATEIWDTTTSKYVG